jgi:threonine dehydratase
LLYEGLKHYFIVRFPQRAGALKEFLTEVLGPDDDIVHFEYTKKTSREKGPALIGIEIQRKEDFEGLKQRMDAKNINAEYLNGQTDLFSYII